MFLVNRLNRIGKIQPIFGASQSIKRFSTIGNATSSLLPNQVITNNATTIINNDNNKMSYREDIHITTTISNGVNKTPTLIGKLVTLRPLVREDRDNLLKASSDGELWNLKVTIVPGPNSVDKYLDIALTEGNSMMPFVIINNETGLIIGSTRYWKVDLNHRKLEIGHTWLSQSIQRSGINTECKYLLLKYAFENLNSIRVQFTTDELNDKSKNAILRIGAKFEGTVRNERIMPCGRKRNSLRFSIIDDEWNNVKLNLIKMMMNK